MIESNHKINWLYRCPWPNVRGEKWSAPKGLQNGPNKIIFFHFYAQIFAKHFDRFSDFSIATIFDDDLLPINRVSTTFASKRWRFCSSHFSDFQTFVTQLVQWSVGWFSNFLKNEIIENIQKCLAILWVLNKWIKRNGKH